MAKAFISYSTEDQKKADHLRSWFLEDGIPVWMAPYDIPAGANWSTAIEDAIRDCSGFVLLLSECSLASPMVKRELQRAAHYDKTILPIQLEPVEVSDEFAFFIDNVSILSLEDFRKHYDEIRHILRP